MKKKHQQLNRKKVHTQTYFAPESSVQIILKQKNNNKQANKLQQ